MSGTHSRPNKHSLSLGSSRSSHQSCVLLKMRKQVALTVHIWADMRACADVWLRLRMGIQHLILETTCRERPCRSGEEVLPSLPGGRRERVLRMQSNPAAPNPLPSYSHPARVHPTHSHPILPFIKCLLYALKDLSRCTVRINSFNPYNNLRRQTLFPSPFYRWGNYKIDEAQRGEVTYPNLHSW